MARPVRNPWPHPAARFGGVARAAPRHIGRDHRRRDARTVRLSPAGIRRLERRLPAAQLPLRPCPRGNPRRSHRRHPRPPAARPRARPRWHRTRAHPRPLARPAPDRIGAGVRERAVGRHGSRTCLSRSADPARNPAAARDLRTVDGRVSRSLHQRRAGGCPGTYPQRPARTRHRARAAAVTGFALGADGRAVRPHAGRAVAVVVRGSAGAGPQIRDLVCLPEQRCRPPLAHARSRRSVARRCGRRAPGAGARRHADRDRPCGASSGDRAAARFRTRVRRLGAGRAIPARG